MRDLDFRSGLVDKTRMTTTRRLRAAFSVIPLLLASLSATLATGAKVAPTNVLVLRGGTVFDSHTGRMIPGQTIIIRGERIETVGPRSSLPAFPRGARVLDLRG